MSPQDTTRARPGEFSQRPASGPGHHPPRTPARVASSFFLASEGGGVDFDEKSSRAQPGHGSKPSWDPSLGVFGEFATHVRRDVRGGIESDLHWGLTDLGFDKPMGQAEGVRFPQGAVASSSGAGVFLVF